MIITVLGQKRYGKTLHLTRRVIAYRKAHPDRPVFIHDLRGWEGGWLQVIGALAPPGARFETAADFYSRGVRNGRLIHSVNLLYKCDAEQLFEVGCWYVDQRRPCLLVCDELDRLGPVLDQRRSPAYRVVNFGAFAGVDVYGSARAPQNVDKGFIAQADELVIFRLTSLQVLRQLRGYGTREAERAADVAPTLPPYKYVVIEP